MTIFVEDKLKPSRVGQRLADASDIEATGDTTMQAEIDALKSTTATAEPVGVGQSFRFVDGDTEYEGLVFNVDPNTFEIDFADSTLDIPAVSAGPFHVVGAHLVSQYTEGLVFSRVRSTTSTGGVGDIEAVVIETISFTDGESFVIPNTQSNVRLGLMKANIDPDTEVVYETARSNTGEQLGSAFRHPAYTNTRQVVFTLDDSSQATSAANIYLVPNKYAIGPTAGNSSDAAVITGAIVNSSNPLQVIVSLASEISLLDGGSNSQVSRYDVEAKVVRHITVESASGAELSDGTLYLGAPPSSGDLSYTGDVPDNNELLVGTGTDTGVKGSNITLNSLGRIPFENIGEADVTLSGTGGSLLIDINNIDTYKNRTIFIDHSNTFTINLDSILDFNDAGSGPFFLRFVQLTDKTLGIQGPISNTIGGMSRQLIPQNGSLTIELPASGQTDWPVLAAGNPLRRFDILQITQSVSYDDDAKLEMICDHLLEVNGNDIALSFTSSTLDCAFWVHNQGVSNVTLQGVGGATLSGYTTLQPGELVWVWNISASSIYRSVKLGDSDETIPTILPENTPIMDTLLAHTGGNPGTSTSQMVALKPNWSGARTLRVTINGISILIGSLTPISGRIERVGYTISSVDWNTIYTDSPTHISWQIEWNNNGTWESIYSVAIPV